MKKYIVKGEADLRFECLGDERIKVLVMDDADVRICVVVSSPCDVFLEVVMVGCGRVKPNMEVSCVEASVEHSLRTVVVSGDELVYLAMRGICEDEARELVMDKVLAEFEGAEII